MNLLLYNFKKALHVKLSKSIDMEAKRYGRLLPVKCDVREEGDIRAAFKKSSRHLPQWMCVSIMLDWHIVLLFFMDLLLSGRKCYVRFLGV